MHTRAPWVTGGRGQRVCWIGRIGRISPAQCGDGLDTLLLLLHALYLPGIRSTYLEHQREDTQRLSEWGSLAGPLLSVHGGSTVGGLLATAATSLAEREQRPCVLTSHNPAKRGPTRRRLQADMESFPSVRSRVSWKMKRQCQDSVCSEI